MQARPVASAPPPVRLPDNASPAPQGLSSVCTALIAKLLGEHQPAPALSVWRPRTNPLEHASAKMVHFNDAFMALCDAAAFPDGNAESAVPMAPRFLSVVTEAEARATAARMFHINDLIHLGRLTHGRTVYVHISRAGRRRAVWLEIFAVHVDNALCELVACESVLPDDFSLPRDLQRYVITPEPVPRSTTRPDATASRLQTSLRSTRLDVVQDGPQSLTWCAHDQRGQALHREYDFRIVSEEDAAARAGNLGKHFRCMHCSVNHTTQKRYTANAQGLCFFLSHAATGAGPTDPTRCAIGAACGGVRSLGRMQSSKRDCRQTDMSASRHHYTRFPSSLVLLTVRGVTVPPERTPLAIGSCVERAERFYTVSRVPRERRMACLPHSPLPAHGRAASHRPRRTAGSRRTG